MFYWIKSDATSATTTYLYNPLTGTKRAITASEWAVVTTFDPTLKVVVIKDTAIAAIPTVK